MKISFIVHLKIEDCKNIFHSTKKLKISIRVAKKNYVELKKIVNFYKLSIKMQSEKVKIYLSMSKITKYLI